MRQDRFEHLLRRSANRRNVLIGGATAAVAFSAPGYVTRSLAQDATPVAVPATNPTFQTSPFTLGIASGDPLPDGVVLWTRLAPDPLNGGGMDAYGPVEVRWEVAADEGFATMVQSGMAVASPELGHSVHIDLRGLNPGSVYFYRFMAGSEVSPTGRTKTAPAANSPVDVFNFAFASCQNYTQGYYPSYEAMAAQDLDIVLHLGDYIYEGAATSAATNIREHNSGEIMTLSDYRNRFALYKGDPDLQEAHRVFPWSTVWDDHEVENNWTAAASENGDPAELFLQRRAAAFQAYYEHQPLRPENMPVGPDMQLYRKLTFGNLVEINMLDTRQYRTDHPCGDGTQVECEAGWSPESTLTGPEQERWLLQNLDQSTARWNVLAQQIMASRLDLQDGTGLRTDSDSWNGYPGARDRIFSHLVAHQISNPVIITGDVHSYYVSDLKVDFDDERSPVFASEFVGTSISSSGDEDQLGDTRREIFDENPHIKYLNGQRRGYISVQVTPDQWHADLISPVSVAERHSPSETLASFVIQDGLPGLQQT